MSLLSLVVPSHNEAESLPFLFDEINHVTQEMVQEHQDLAVEVIVVDDGSTDHTLDVLKNIVPLIPRHKPRYFSRFAGFLFHEISGKKLLFMQGSATLMVTM